MTVKIGINGFGRIGRCVFRAIDKDPAFKDVQVVAINDPASKSSLAHLLKYDSIFGVMKGEVKETAKGISVNGREIQFTGETSPEAIKWGAAGADYVIESTGRFTTADTASGHLKGGAKRVIISAPAKGGIKTFVMGINEDEYNPKEHVIVSNASCTTNCLAPFTKVILEKFGIISGLITTVHAYTGDQRLTDMPHSDPRRARAAALSMIPTTTGAASAIGLVLPQLKGKLDGLALRVPTPTVSVVDAVFHVEKPATPDEVRAALRGATSRYLRYTDEKLVSVDFLGDPHSSIVDGPSTYAIGSTIKVLSWYDNEWGYSNRVLDLINHMASQEI
ncbi:MAG: type I glyceraldehyde-3-phosphate dehydrogenase [Magnetococcales bacterium]|nr:type I glyceraldehyde-3-phosphate dehydrogenase [Magnetococcales bacterium]